MMRRDPSGPTSFGLVLALGLVLAPVFAARGAPPPAGISPLVPSAVTAAFLEAEAHWIDAEPFPAAAAYRSALEKALALDGEAREAGLPEAKLGIHRLVTLTEETGETRELKAVLEKWASAAGPDAAAGPGGALHLTAALARFHLGFAVLDGNGPAAPPGLGGGTREEADAAWKPLGFLEGWRVVGPFDNERNGNFLTALGPEEKLDLDASYPGKKRAIRWRPLPVRPLVGRVDLGALFVPREQALAYAVTFVEAREEAGAAIRFSSDEGCRVWVNGDLAASVDAERAHGFDLNAAGIHLQKGWNTILLKLPQTTGSWEFSARITRPDGSPLDGIAEGTPSGAASPRAPSEPPASPPLAPPRVQGGDAPQNGGGVRPPIEVGEGPEAELAKAIEKDASSARAHYVLGSLLLERRSHDAGEHPDTERLARAIQIDDSSPAYHIALARSHERETTIEAQKEENAWRRALEAASERGSTLADLDLAEYYRGTFANNSRAHALVARALSRRPANERAIRLTGEIERALEFPRAIERAREKAFSLPRQSIDTLLEKAEARRREGRLEEARSILEGVLSVHARNPSAREALARLRIAAGDGDGAVEVLRAGAALDPFQSRWQDLVSGMEEARDRLEAAIECLDRALALRPEDHEILARKAKLVWRLDRKDEALAVLDQAIELQPNSPEIREYADYLRSVRAGFEDEFRMDTSAIVKGAWEAKEGDDSGVPARVLLQLAAVKVNRDGTTQEFVQDVIRILSERGLRMYDSYGTSYAEGEQVLEFKKARVHRPDGSIADAKLSRHGDDPQGEVSYRGASLDLPPLSVGDVIEVEYVREDIAQSFFGDYFGRREVFQDNVPIDQKVLILRVPGERKVYFHERNLGVEPLVAKDDASGGVTYTWIKKDIPKLDPEPAMPDPVEVSPLLEVSTFESWTAFDTWYWNLIRKQFEVSPDISKKVRELTSGADTDIDRIRSIYNFIVTDIRYNAWEFGVHGFKPYNASAIFARRFGDCKDKATLLSVMLREAGIKSHPVLIKADDRRGAEDLTLPMVHHFNHCITYVPPGKGHGEMYLDGTAQFHPFTHLPSMDRGAAVLVVRDDGGELLRIPWNEPDDLAIDEEVTVQLRMDLGAELQVRARMEGDYAVYVRQSFEIPAQRKTQLERTFGRRYAASSVTSESFSDLMKLDEPVSFSVTLDVPRFAVEAPEGLALRAPEDFFGTGKSLAGIGSLEKRTQDVLLANPRSSTLRTVYSIPEGFRVKSLPAGSVLESRFGRLEVAYRREDPRKVVFERRIVITSPRVPVADYAELREFAAAIDRLEHERILLERS